ncbi:MAG: GspH/FimT family pseudopilin [Gammaproteobacteria bacterium]|nr:GspH/FimT family pseudopilin [Gammaproteobacteria bacterium]
MYSSYLKHGCTNNKGTPFICLFLPFIGLNNPVESPFVGQNRPFVCNKGFTLVELIVAMTIAAILMAIAAPAMQKFVSSNRLTSQVNDLMGDINLARSEAIKRAVRTGVCVTAVDGTTCAAGGNWANGWMVYFDNSGAKQPIKFHERLTGNNTLTSPGDEIIYFENGLISSGAGRFTLTDTNITGQRFVCVGATGRPSLIKDGVVACP